MPYSISVSQTRITPGTTQSYFTIKFKHRYDLLNYQCQTTVHDLALSNTDTSSQTVLSMPNQWARSWAVKHWHKLVNCSINAKPLCTILRCQTLTQACKLFYQCQTNGHDIRDYQFQTNGHNLINSYAKRGTITSRTVIKLKAESIPFNVYLDIYVTD